MTKFYMITLLQLYQKYLPRVLFGNPGYVKFVTSGLISRSLWPSRSYKKYIPSLHLYSFGSLHFSHWTGGGQRSLRSTFSGGPGPNIATSCLVLCTGGGVAKTQCN